ncbi:hypothetical protein [Streptomyces melanogenes]|uniref:hypothetical protein n=1 Tax=Streptomyces melanogenes TaxID=67326 RepID=UPI0037B1ABA3
MSHHTPSDKGEAKGEEDTALDEVFHEIEEAATKPVDPKRRERGHPDRHDGEAGDALTPNTGAQKRAGT